MKKIFYFLASAIVALGAMACQNEVDENINPNTQSDVVSFTVAFDEATRIAMSIEDKTAKFAFEADDVLYVWPRSTNSLMPFNPNNEPYVFTTEDGETFSCKSAELVEALEETDNHAIVSNARYRMSDSYKGIDGFLFSNAPANDWDLPTDISGKVTLNMLNSVLKLTVPEDTEATLVYVGNASASPFIKVSEDGGLSLSTQIVLTSGDHMVAAVYATGGTLSYSINGVVVKSIEKDFEAGKIYNLGTLDTNMTIANVAALINNAEVGSTVTLPKNATITGSEILTINKSITINGNGATFTSTAGRAINIETDGVVKISDLTVVCSGERVFNIINQPATVNISGVTATAANYAIMVATSAGAATVNVAESTLTGMNVVNVAGEGAQVTVTNCTLNCNDNSNVEAYAALALYNTAEGAKITATGCTINVAGDSYKAWNSSKTGTITISDGEVVNAIAYIDYNNGYSYSFSSLAKAIETAKGDDVIVLLQDAVMIAEAGTYNINVNGKTLTPAEGTKLTIEGTTVTVAPTVATIQALINNAAAGSTITLPAGATITGSEILTISKNITINGNGATFTSTAGRAINIETDGVVKISDLTVVCSGERVFNIINQPATVNISGVTATAANYAIMVATSAGAATVNVAESTLTGMNVVNVAGEGAQVTVTNCTLNCNDNSNVEAYAALALYNTAEGAKITATGCTINVAGDSYKAWNSSKTGTITISDGEVVNAIAYIDYNNGYSYSFSSLAEAIETAEGDDVIVLIRDAEIDQVGEFKIDLNGHKLTAADGYIATKDGENIKVVALGEAIENWGVVGAHQGWNTDKTDKMFQIPGTNTYVKRNVTLGKDGFKFYSETSKTVIVEHPAVTTGEEGDYYLVPNNNWKKDSARFAIYFFKDGGASAWVSMKDENGDGIYVANKPTGDFNMMIFCRMNPANGTNDWSNKWNQTGDLAFPTNNNNCYTITEGSWDAGKWSVHTPEIKDAWTEEVEEVTQYWIGKESTDDTTKWVTRWSNNTGNDNITVTDTDKKYDIYFYKGDDKDWGFEVQYIVVESGTVLDTLK